MKQKHEKPMVDPLTAKIAQLMNVLAAERPPNKMAMRPIDIDSWERAYIASRITLDMDISEAVAEANMVCHEWRSKPDDAVVGMKFRAFNAIPNN